MTEFYSSVPESEPHTGGLPPTPAGPRRIIVQSVSLMLAMVMICGAMGIYVLSDRAIHSAFSLATAAAAIDRTYPGQINWNDVFLRGVDGMTSILDRYSGYLDVSGFGRLDEEFEGEYIGIGISVVRDPDGLLVMSVREHGPADEAGLMTGDVIIRIGDSAIGGLEATRSTSMLRGKEGTSATITLVRATTNDTLILSVPRRKLNLVHVPFAGYTPDSMVYIRALDFEGGASREIEEALDSLVINTSYKPRGLILDLRGNPGGLFNEAYHTANLFLNRGQFIVGTESRSRWKVEELSADGPDVTDGLPMAVLVDRGSASAAEIVAGALQKNKRAVLVGDTTFGKGLVQGFTRFGDGDGLRLTISRYYLAGMTFLNQVDSMVHDSGTGLPPDYFFASEERRAFPQALERSLLLNKFAQSHEPEILSSDSVLEIDQHLAERFAIFARDNGFSYASPETEAAVIVADVSHLEESGPQVIAAAKDLVSLARQHDSLLFTEYTGYIESRLRQLAVEHRYGLYQSYARVIVRDRADIRYAARLLKVH
jgi:C-terminal peptidase prc